MPVSCSAFNCTRRYKKGEDITFHLFPKDPIRKAQWVQAIRRENWNPSVHSRVCSLHFEAQWFDRTGQTVRLREGAVPTIFDFPPHLQKNIKHRKPPTKRTLETSNNAESSVCTEIPSVPLAQDHAYAVMESPRKLKRQLDDLRSVIDVKTKTVKKIKKDLSRLEQKYQNITSLIEELCKKRMISESAEEVLKTNFTGLPLDLLKRVYHNKGQASKDPYSKEIRSFALTLSFYSQKAYDFVREVFEYSLPHPSTLRRWYSSIDGSPGFTSSVYHALQLQVQKSRDKGQEIFCSLAIDEMTIKKHVCWNGHRFTGYVDLGTELDNDALPPAKSALVFLIVAINQHWKVPCCYFFIDSLSGSERANLVQECLKRLHDTGIKVTSITFDGTAVNFTMAACLGASLNLQNLNPSFPHPVTKKPVFVILDACHMIKLARNTLADKKLIKDSEGGVIKWEYLYNLQKLQEREGLRLANKLTPRHIQFQKQKMKVNLAVQTLSSSVADALEFCEKELHLPEFQGCAATVKYIRMHDRLFDLMNSRNALAKNFKAPLRKSNEPLWSQFSSEVRSYLQGLEEPISGRKVAEGNRKTAIVGFLVSLTSIRELYDHLVSTPTAPLKYLLTYKFSQDHLELFFNSIRRRGGWNNNPTVQQFEAAYKRLLLHHVKSSSNGNCEALDNTSILFSHSSHDSLICTDIADISQIRRADEVSDEPTISEHNYSLPALMTLSLYCENVVEYIAGFVVKALLKKLKCSTCAAALITEESNFRLISHKDRGGLIHPNKDVVTICKTAETVIKGTITPNKLDSSRKLLPSLIVKTTEILSERGLFVQLKDHSYDMPPDDNHAVRIMKQIIEQYIKIRLYHVGKTYSQHLVRDPIRSHLTKTIHFKNQ